MGAKTILIVEDREDLRDLLRIGLKQAGFLVEETANGFEALEFLRSHALPDVVVVDLEMPVMDGEQFCRVRLNDTKLKRIPVIIYSNDSDAALVASRLAAEACVSKCAPFGLLVGEIERVLH